MTSTTREFFNLIEENIRFEHHSGQSTLVGFQKTVGWRVLPMLVVAQLGYASTVDFNDRETVRIQPGQTISITPGRAHKFTKLTRRAAYSRWAHIQCEIFPEYLFFTSSSRRS